MWLLAMGERAATSGRFAKSYIQTWTPGAGTTPPPTGGAATKVEAESYHVMSGVPTRPTTDAGGGLNVGWLDPGDWMAHTITAPTAGTTRCSFGWPASTAAVSFG